MVWHANLIILIEISSHPWAFLGFKVLIILLISSSVKETYSKELLVNSLKYGRGLLESISVHCLAKKSLNNFAFSWMSVTNTLL